MKLRDTLNTREGYQEILDENIIFIKEQLKDLQTSVTQKEINYTNESLFYYTLSSLQANYSQGGPVEELIPL